MREANDEQMLRNPEIEPSDEVIANALGEANKAYETFINALNGYDIQLEWRYYKDGKAWLAKGLFRWIGVRGGQKVETVFWLSVWKGFFKVTFYFPEKVRMGVLNLPLDPETRGMIEASQQMGKLKCFPLVFDLSSDEKFESLFMLLDFKKSIK